MSVLVQCAQKHISSTWTSRAGAVQQIWIQEQCQRLQWRSSPPQYVVSCDKLLRKCLLFDAHTPKKFWVLPLIYLASEVETWLEQLKHVKSSLRNCVVQNKNNSKELNNSGWDVTIEIPLIPGKNVGELLFEKRHGLIFHRRPYKASHNPYITGCRTPYIQQITSVSLLRCCLIVLVVLFLVVGHHELVLPTFHVCFHTVISPHIQKDFGVWACDCISFSS